MMHDDSPNGKPTPAADAAGRPDLPCATPRRRAATDTAARPRPSRTWPQIDAEIKQGLDQHALKSLYEGWGAVFEGTPSSTGWWKCHALGREDSDPSAGVFFGSGPRRGMYKDFGGEGSSLGLYDAGARFGEFGDWKHCRNRIADRLGVALPGASGVKGRARGRAAGATPVPPPEGATRAPAARKRAVKPSILPPADPGENPEEYAARRKRHLEAVLDLAEMDVLGENDDGSIEIFSRHHRKVVRVDSIDRFSYLKFMQACGEAAYRFYTGKDEGVRPDGTRPFEWLRVAIPHFAGRTNLGRADVRGQGIWREGGQVVLVNGGTAATLRGGALVAVESPRFNGSILDFSATQPWADLDRLGGFLSRASDPAWSLSVLEEAQALFGRWNWKHPQDSWTTALLAACTFVQTLWPWRPEVAVTGPSDSGKTSVFDLLKSLFGPLAFSTNKPSEAGIRQHVGNRACAIMVDEFESDGKRQAILELFRTTSQGGGVVRGTSDQKGKTFGLKHIPWMAAIESGLVKAADRNRFIILDLSALPKDVRGKLRLPGVPELEELGTKLCAVALAHIDRAVELFRHLKGQRFEGVHGRVVENFSVPASLWASVQGKVGDDAVRVLSELLDGRKSIARQGGGDEMDVLKAILDSTIFVGNGMPPMGVTEILGDRDAFERHGDTLANNGLGLVGDEKKAGRRPRGWVAENWGNLTRLFIDPQKVRRYPLKDTDWAGKDIQQLLERIPGARCERASLASTQVSGVTIPVAALGLDTVKVVGGLSMDVGPGGKAKPSAPPAPGEPDLFGGAGGG